MQRWTLHFFVILSLTSLALSDVAACVAACQLALRSVSFEDTPANLPYYSTQCSSALRLQSVYACSWKYCPATAIQPGLDQANKTCVQYGNVTLPSLDGFGNLDPGDIDSLRVLNRTDVLMDLNISQPAIPSQLLFEDARRTNAAYQTSMTSSVLYAIVMFVFWTLVVLTGLGFRFVSFLSQKARFRKEFGGGSGRYARFERDVTRQLKQHLLVPAAFSHHCAEPLGWWIVPPRLQSLIILTFVVLNVILSFGHYDVFSTNLYWPDHRLQYARYVGDRTGVMGTANLTLIYLFATRNNVLLWITGWSFETSMQFHRWVARVSTVQAIVHSLAYSLYVLVEGGMSHYRAVWLQRYWTLGAVATVAMSLLLVFSLYPIRHKVYELFLFLHTTLAVLVLIGMWYHVEIFSGAYNVFLWPCIIIWIADRVARLWKVIRYNIPYRAGFATYSPQTNVVWLNVPRVSSSIPVPGSYYFLYLLHGTKWYESHPFTLSGWECQDQAQAQDLDQTRDLALTTTTATTSTHKQALNLQFIIRPYNGLTGRFRDLVRCQGGDHKNGRNVRVLVEGPYGPKHNLQQYDTIGFIVGGTGVAITLSYISDMLFSARSKIGAGSPGYTYRVHRLHIVWAVRELSLFQETFDRELRPKLTEMSKLSGRPMEVHIQIYNTGGTNNEEQRQSTDAAIRDAELEPMVSSDDSVQFLRGDEELQPDEHSPLSSPPGTVTPDGLRLSIYRHRPRLENIVMRFVASDVGDDNSTCAIVACCPAAMADDARKAVVEAIGQGYGGIDFYPESYAW
ncbi:hypothetical protein PV10_00703 [Exophiala mesophila]|uniref:FAD-binding FR-type domain-containing protein n=1 Tax=Exophiala mesophila TaxID=212818 RepID=A0A0D1ZSJ5_EXOME|nr:uncharacterized protein PV10_00703 [Exophiala mesophila]KIV96889.1 hypothetical protein PV10_00703 [Exophiala mesophila]